MLCALLDNTPDFLLGFIIYASFTLLTWLLVLAHRRLNHWRQLGVSHSKAFLFFGNLLSHRSLETTFSKTFQKFRCTAEPFCGFYFFMEPAALILDAGLAWNILTKDKLNFNIKSPSCLKMDFNLENVLEANNLVVESLGKKFTKMELVVNVNYFCHKHISAVIGLLYGVGLDNVVKSSSTNCVLRKLRYCLGVLYAKDYYEDKNNLSLLKNLAICRDVATSVLARMLLELSKNKELEARLRSKLLALSVNDEKFDGGSFAGTDFLDDELGAILEAYTPYSHIILRTREQYPTKMVGYTLCPNQLVIIPNEMFVQRSRQFYLYDFKIGSHEAILVKTALMTLLRAYNFSTCRATPNDVEFEEILPHKLLKTQIYLKIRKTLNDSNRR